MNVSSRRFRKNMIPVALIFLCIATVLPIMPATASDKPASANRNRTVEIIWGGGAQFEIRGPDRQRIFTDVTDPAEFTGPVTPRDILLTTHFDFDHFNQSFIDTFPGQHLHSREGKIERPGLTITSIGAHHSEQATRELKTEEGSNFLFVIEVAGIRIAHFGDIGQPRLTQDQLTKLGRVDIAITQFLNPYSQMSVENEKGYRLMDAVRPKLILPHHGAGSDNVVRLAHRRWGAAYTTSNTISMTRARLPLNTTFLVLGEMADYMQKTFNLPPWPSP